MTYEIPTELEYQEKVLFGLTFRQLAYALLFLPLVIIALFKLPFDLTIRIFLATIPSALAGFFMFTKIPQTLFYMLKWQSWRTIPQEKMKQYLGIQAIQKGVIQLKKKNIAILKIEPLNFSIRNKQEKEILILTFQKFLNSLDFPLQILIATDTMNLDDYLHKLNLRVDAVTKETQNPTFDTIFNKYQQHLLTTIKEDSLLNRSFYLVIPESMEIGLEIQAKVCEEHLKNMNLKYTRLEGEELTLMVSSFFHDIYAESATRETKDALYRELS